MLQLHIKQNAVWFFILGRGGGNRRTTPGSYYTYLTVSNMMYWINHFISRHNSSAWQTTFLFSGFQLHVTEEYKTIKKLVARGVESPDKPSNALFWFKWTFSQKPPLRKLNLELKLLNKEYGTPIQQISVWKNLLKRLKLNWLFFLGALRTIQEIIGISDEDVDNL